MAGNANSGRRPTYSGTERQVLGFPPSRRNDQEPLPPPDPVKKPSYLSKMADEVWDELAPRAIEIGRLTVADVAAFAKLCELEATARHASKQKDAPEFGMFTIGEDYNGVPKVGVHAAIKVERETTAALKPYYEKFGLDPVGRRIKVPTRPKAPKSKWQGDIA